MTRKSPEVRDQHRPPCSRWDFGASEGAARKLAQASWRHLDSGSVLPELTSRAQRRAAVTVLSARKGKGRRSAMADGLWAGDPVPCLDADRPIPDLRFGASAHKWAWSIADCRDCR